MSARQRLDLLCFSADFSVALSASAPVVANAGRAFANTVLTGCMGDARGFRGHTGGFDSKPVSFLNVTELCGLEKVGDAFPEPFLKIEPFGLVGEACVLLSPELSPFV